MLATDLVPVHHPGFQHRPGLRFVFTRLDSTPPYGQLVTGNYLTILGMGAALGRMLLPPDATTAVGLALGSRLALGVARIFAANIVKSSTFEPVAFGGGAMLVWLWCVMASYVPSRRAARVDPAEALRGE